MGLATVIIRGDGTIEPTGCVIELARPDQLLVYPPSPSHHERNQCVDSGQYEEDDKSG